MHDTQTLPETKSLVDVDKIRKDFPVLSKTIHGKPLVYLDNAATTQKPWSVIDRVHGFESEEYGTV
ncbi:MAG: cysteine desulfurase CsdA, partial [Nitrospinales bacterium]